MSNAWPPAPMASAIQHRKEFIQIDDLQDYKMQGEP